MAAQGKDSAEAVEAEAVEAEAEARGSGLYLPRGAFAIAEPSDANSWQSPPGSDGEDTDSSEDCEELCCVVVLNILRSIPTEMDCKGQKLAEQIFQGIILVSAIIGFIYGYITKQFEWTAYIVIAGLLLSCLLTLLLWPMYRCNRLQWLPVQQSEAEDKKSADRKPKRHAKN